MKTRRMFLVALCGVAMLIGASSCKKEKQENENGETMTIKASLGSADNNSKTHLVGPSVIWDPSDAFKLFPTEGTAGTKFSLTRIDEQDGKVAYFEGKHPGGEHFYACYPFNKVSCTTARTFTFSIPQLQNGSPETVSDNTNAGPMVGYMENVSGSLTFQNAMSWLKVGLKGNVVIKRVVLTDNTPSLANNKLNGMLTVTCSVDEGGVFSFTSEMDRNTGTNQLVIVSNDGVQLDDTNPTYFWFQVPAGSLANLNLSAYLDVEGTKNVLNLNKTITHGESVPGIGVNTILTANVNSPIIEDILPGLFTVGVDVEGNLRKVYFSKGNLQYNATGSSANAVSGENVGGTWRFAEHQFDIIGADNKNAAQDYSGWIDLFCWGTSGYNHGATCYQPWSKSKTNSEYYAYSSSSNHLYSSNGTADWGANPISNGGGYNWRTLTGGNVTSDDVNSGEWAYLLNVRSVNGGHGEGYSYQRATINSDGTSVYGMILYPDNYTAQTSATSYTCAEWATMEAAGCAFLPVTGRRVGATFDNKEIGHYWSSSYFNGNSAYSLYFKNGEVIPGNSDRYRCHGRSVRLVSDAN